MTTPRRITIRELAAELGVSPTTVSFVLNERDRGISPAVTERIWQAACAHRLVRPGRRRAAGRLQAAYVIRQAADLACQTTFFRNLYCELQSQAAAQRIDLTLRELNAALPPDQYFRQYESLLREEFDLCVTCDVAIGRFLRDHGAKVVLCQAGELLDGVINFYCDDYAAGALAARYLWDNGHRAVGTVFFTWSGASPRFCGFRDAFSALGGELDDALRWHVSSDLAVAEAELDALLTAQRVPATAFYCYADNILFPLLRALLRHGWSVPDQISLVGTDNLFWGAVATPAFSTVDLHEAEFAALVLQALPRAVSDYTPSATAVPVSLLPRESVRRLTPAVN